MDKGLLKTIILGASLIISVLIYSEANKYDSSPIHRDGGVVYLVLNKKTGEVKTYGIGRAAAIYKSSFKTNKIEYIEKDFSKAKD